VDAEHQLGLERQRACGGSPRRGVGPGIVPRLLALNACIWHNWNIDAPVSSGIPPDATNPRSELCPYSRSIDLDGPLRFQKRAGQDLAPGPDPGGAGHPEETWRDLQDAPHQRGKGGFRPRVGTRRGKAFLSADSRAGACADPGVRV